MTIAFFTQRVLRVIMMTALAVLFAPALAFQAKAGGLRMARMCSAEPLWDEEIEQIEHLQNLAAQARQVNELKELAQCPNAAQLPGGHPATSAEATCGDDQVAVLWDEDVETMDMLHEMAAWDTRVAALREIADGGATDDGCDQRSAGTNRLGPGPNMALCRHRSSAPDSTATSVRSRLWAHELRQCQPVRALTCHMALRGLSF